MTTHELARKLLQLPDVPVTTFNHGPTSDYKEVNEDDIMLMTEEYINAEHKLQTGPILYIA
jgi:hypothetical protein